MSLKIALLSDLHLEHSNFKLELGDADVLLVAGDIMAGPKPEEGVMWLRERVYDRPIVYVPGNHEFDCTYIKKGLERMKKAAEGSLIEVLHNESFEWGGVRFLGTPLYSGFRREENGPPQLDLLEKCKQIDGFSITAVDVGQPWTPQVMSEWHDEAKAWLSGELEDCEVEEIPSVVVTHWAPSFESSDAEFKDDEFSSYWVNPCDSLVERSHFWVHGHVHSSVNCKIGAYKNRGQLYCNPRGVSKIYDLSPNPGFKRPLIFEVPKWEPRIRKHPQLK